MKNEMLAKVDNARLALDEISGLLEQSKANPAEVDAVIDRIHEASLSLSWLIFDIRTKIPTS
jgi:hypothetical protein